MLALAEEVETSAEVLPAPLVVAVPSQREESVGAVAVPSLQWERPVTVVAVVSQQ